MKPLASEQFLSDPRIAQAQRLIGEALQQHQGTLDAVRPADPERKAASDELIRRFNEARGGNLYFPYLAAGLGHGPLVELADGSVKFDLISGIGVHHFGHSHAGLVAAGVDAALRDTIMQGNLQQDVESAALGTELVQAAPPGSRLVHAFVATSGAMANENALKLVFHKRPGTSRIMAFEHTFAGRTLALSSLTDKAAYRAGLPAALNVDYVPFFDADHPAESTARAVEAIRVLAARYPNQHAALWCELVLGEGGFYPGSREFFAALGAQARTHNMLVVADEIQTFGRTSRLFACEHFGLQEMVDVATVGKMLQACATLFTDALKPAPGIVSQTFTASTSAVFAARMILRELRGGNLFGEGGRNLQMHERFVRHFTEIAGRHPKWIRGPYGIGGMIAFTAFDGTDEQAKKLLGALFESSVIAFYNGSRPTRIRFLPPAPVLTDTHIDTVCGILEKALRRWPAALEDKEIAMLVIRPIQKSDLESLLELAGLTGFGLTTLPRDRDLLAERILDSEHSFLRMPARPRGDSYLFVMEDPAAKRVIGTCGITSKVGGFEPFYAYRVETSMQHSEMLNVHKEIQTLTLVAEHNGPCEIGSLFLHPDYRRDGNGRLLSLSRFLFVAEHPQRFDPVVIAEMRGVIDDQGRSPFWDALGKHFFEIDFPKADYLSMVNKKFIADLMPRHPIYVPLLPLEAQAVIGKVHPETRPALKLLQSEGFHITDEVDIFEAGPVVSVQRDEIRTVRESVRGVVEEIVAGPLAAPAMHILNPQAACRACRGPVEVLAAGGLRLERETAAALQVRVGDTVRFAATHPRPVEKGLP